MSPAAHPLEQLAVGVVVERHKSSSQWIDFTWKPVNVLPDEPNAKAWTVLREGEGVTAYYAGGAMIDLYRSETARYRENLESGSPAVWVVLGATGSEPPYKVNAVTVDPSEGEGFTASADYIVEPVPMPEVIEAAVARFIGEHHVERAFVKRKRKAADTEALAQKPGGGARGKR